MTQELSSPAENLVKTQSQLQSLARANLGLYQPEDLQASLKAIVDANTVTSWNIQDNPLETVGYFLGHEIACEQWRSNLRRSGVEPFNGIQRLAFPKEFSDENNPVNVLLVGCASANSYELEQQMLRKKQVHVGNHATVDISLLPLRRINRLVPHTALVDAHQHRTAQPGVQQLIHADIAHAPIPKGDFDLVLTDLFFGANSRPTDELFLKNIWEYLWEDGKFVVKASILSDNHVQGLRSVMNNIGLFWQDNMIYEYGENKETGRDNYLGLTPTQWCELGQLYSKFIQATYFGPNRFTSQEEFAQFLTKDGLFKISDRSVLKEPIDDTPPIEYVTFLAEKVA